MLSKMNGFEAIYLYAGKSDLRKGIDGLGRRWILPCIQAHRSRPSPVALLSTGSCTDQSS